MRFVESFAVPCVRLPGRRRLEIEGLLVESNLVLRGYYLSAGDFPGGLRAFFAEVCRHGRAGGVVVPAGDLGLIRRAKEVEWELLCDCSGLMRKICSRWRGCVDAEDLGTVAVEAFLKALCGFTGGVRFSTYLTRCVERGVIDAAKASGNPLGFPLEVVRRRREVQRLMRREGATLDSAVEEAGVPEGSVGMVVRSMGGVENLGEVDVAARECDCGVGIDHMEALSVLGGLELDRLEKAVLDELLRSGGDLNLSSLARRLVNPATGKCYTRMNMSLVWRRLKDKMLRACRKAA